MNEPTMETLARRLDRVEREIRRWRCVAVVAGGLLALVGLVGVAKPDTTSVPDEIRAKRFVLVDEAGRARAKLSMDSVTYRGQPAPELRFLDEEDRRNVILSNLFGLTIADDDTGKGRVDLTAGGLTLSDKFGKVIWSAP